MNVSERPTFDSHNPVTSQPIFTFPIQTAGDVQEVVSKAKLASSAWRELGYGGRRKVLLAWANSLTERIDECAELISLETGKPVGDAKLEAVLAIGHLAWSARNAETVLKTQQRRPGLLMANMQAKVERSPLGVVGVIGPWNYPIFTPMGSISYALAAGNTVVFKPSEYAPGVGTWIVKSFSEIAPCEGILSIITGLGDTGRALCESEVNKVAFTGSAKTAKLVAAVCATRMTPVILECGGKDPVIVDEDADIDRAAEYSLWSALSNAGQTCIGAERIYVHEKVAAHFTSVILEQAKNILPGAPGTGNYGPATMPKQLDVIEAHISDALTRGGKAILGGMKSIKPPFVEPVILTGVPEDSIAMTEETFGPIIIINKVADMEQAISLSNASSYGLAASVWSKRNGEKIASRLHCGMVAINSTISFAAVASVPFGGVKESGYGRIHGPEGLLEFTYSRTVVRARFQLPISFTSFKRTKFADKLIVGLVKTLHGRSLG
ncbi:MAG: aldehyde dehydrogenase family protein [Actinobacteria bacterium]|nr:aldehyde dehydrogenase family protein [Actinomycetota bacterium]